MKLLVLGSTITLISAVTTAGVGSVGGEATSVGSGTKAPAPLEPPVMRGPRGVAAASDSAYGPIVNGPVAVESPVASTALQVVSMPVAGGVGTPVASNVVESPILKELMNRPAIHAASSSVSKCSSISQSSQDHNSQVVQSSGSGDTVSSTGTETFSGGVGGGSGAGATATGTHGVSPPAVAHVGGYPVRYKSVKLTPAEILGANPGPVLFNYPLPPIESSAVENRVQSNRSVLSRPNITAKEATPSPASAPAITLHTTQGIEDGQTPGSGAGLGVTGPDTRPSSAVLHHPSTGPGGPNSSGLDYEELEDSSSSGTGSPTCAGPVRPSNGSRRPNIGSISSGPGGSGRHSPGSGVPKCAGSGSCGIGGSGFGAGSGGFGSSGTSITGSVGPGAGPQVPTAESPVSFQGCAAGKYVPVAIIPALTLAIAFGMM